jgi:hypothetical protein
MTFEEWWKTQDIVPNDDWLGKDIAKIAWRASELRSKPDWADAPAWAEFLACDLTGVWYWYDEEPTAGGYVWDVPSQLEFASKDKIETWKNTLEKRP